MQFNFFLIDFRCISASGSSSFLCNSFSMLSIRPFYYILSIPIFSPKSFPSFASDYWFVVVHSPMGKIFFHLFGISYFVWVAWPYFPSFTNIFWLISSSRICQICLFFWFHIPLCFLSLTLSLVVANSLSFEENCPSRFWVSVRVL